MSNEIIKVLDDLSRRFGLAIDWGSENVVPYVLELVQKFYKYKLMTSLFWIVVGVLLLIIGIIATVKIVKDEDFDDVYSDEGCFFVVIGLIVIYVVGIALLLINTYNCIVTLTFPELQLIDYLKELL